MVQPAPEGNPMGNQQEAQGALRGAGQGHIQRLAEINKVHGNDLQACLESFRVCREAVLYIYVHIPCFMQSD